MLRSHNLEGVIVVTVSAICATLIACTPSQPPTQPRKDVTTGLADNGLVIYTDTITGCQYVKANGIEGAVTPRLRADGTPGMGCVEKP